MISRLVTGRTQAASTVATTAVPIVRMSRVQEVVDDLLSLDDGKVGIAKVHACGLCHRRGRLCTTSDPLAAHSVVASGFSRTISLLIPDAAPEGTSVIATALSGQGLPGLLPMGWSPIAARDLRGPVPTEALTLRCCGEIPFSMCSVILTGPKPATPLHEACPRPLKSATGALSEHLVHVPGPASIRSGGPRGA